MALFDPIDRYGFGWKTHDNGRELRELRVVIKDGRYCFEDRRTGRVDPIPNAISPREERDMPRSERDQPRQRLERLEGQGAQQDPRRREQQAPISQRYELQTAATGSRSASHPSVSETTASRRGVPIQTPKPSQDALASNPTLENSSQSDLLLDFIAIPYSDFEECNAFIKENRRILDVDVQSLLHSAVQSRRIGDDLRTHRCVQRYVILKACKSRNARERDDYFYHLEGKGEDKAHQNEYARDFHQALNSVRRLFEASAIARREPTLSTSRNQGSGNDQLNMNDQSQQSYSVHGPPVPSYRPPAMPSTAAQPTTAAFSSYGQQTSRFQPNQTSGEVLVRNFPPQSGTTVPYMPTRRKSGLEDSHGPAAPSVPISRANMNFEHGNKATHDRSSSHGTGVSYPHPAREIQPGRDKRLILPTVGGLDNVEFRGLSQLQVADTELLDPNYTLRDDSFFFEGRVFSMMFHENFGLERGKLQPPSIDGPGVTRGPKGEYIFSHIRRWVVVRQRKGYSMCVPINSYRQQGVSGRRVGNDGAQAHAIVYSSRWKDPPAALPGEPRFKKKPIAVDLMNNQELSNTSRIHFGKIHSIEHNIKVMNIGYVAQRSMADFQTYWKEEFAR